MDWSNFTVKGQVLVFCKFSELFSNKQKKTTLLSFWNDAASELNVCISKKFYKFWKSHQNLHAREKSWHFMFRKKMIQWTDAPFAPYNTLLDRAAYFAKFHPHAYLQDFENKSRISFFSILNTCCIYLVIRHYRITNLWTVVCMVFLFHSMGIGWLSILLPFQQYYSHIRTTRSWFSYERLCAVELIFQLSRFCLEQGSKLGTARSAGQHLTHRASRAPLFHRNPKDLDPSCKMDRDLWDCCGIEKLGLITKGILFSKLFWLRAIPCL